MKRLIFNLGIIFIPIGFVIIATNIYIDPANIFSGEKYVERIATILVSGNNADNISNYNEMFFQKNMLQKQTQKPDVLVMGSSRVMEVGANIFPNKKLLNIAVSRGNINDLIAVAGLVDSLKQIPKEVVINVEANLICKGSVGNLNGESLNEYYNFFSSKNCNINSNKKTSNFNNIFQRYYGMLNFDYFKSSVAFVVKKRNKTLYNVGKDVPKMGGRLSNGCVVYSYSYSHPDTINVAAISKEAGVKTIFPPIDSMLLNSFNCLIDYFQKNGTNITLTMLPFHKDYYDEVKKKNNFIEYYENYFTTFANKKNIKIVGSFSPTKIGLCKKDFYDTYHCNGDAVKRVFQNYQ